MKRLKHLGLCSCLLYICFKALFDFFGPFSLLPLLSDLSVDKRIGSKRLSNLAKCLG